MTPVSGLKTVWRDVEKLSMDPLNVRVHNERSIVEIMNSLRRFGQQKAIVIDSSDTVRAGNGTLEALRRLGTKRVACHVSDLSDDELRAYAIMDNRSGEFAEWDLAGLLETIPVLDESLLDSIGFTADELAEFARQLDAGSAFPPDGLTPGEGERIFGDDDIIASALAHYRERGFPYPSMTPHERMQQMNALASTPDDLLRNSTVAYHVADRFHPQRFAVRCSNKVTPVEAFDNDTKLSHAFRMILDAGGKITDTSLLSVLGYVRGAQMAAQFRPGFALSMLRRFLPDQGVWLDTSAGYGGRLTAYAASHASAYIGIDPSTESIAGNSELALALAVQDSTTLIELPAEDVPVEQVGGRGSVDLVFTSPPYFAKEAYADEPTQSFVRYPAPEQWRGGFLLPMLDLACAALRPGAFCIINIADVKVGGDSVPLVDWTIEGARKVGLVLEAQEAMPMPRVPGKGDRGERIEPCIVFRKPKPRATRRR